MDRQWVLGRLIGAIVVGASLLTGAARASDAESPVGRWQTFDDRTHLPRGVVRIFEKDGKLFGRIERAGDRAVCRACPDERKDQPLDGLVIIRNMQREPADPHAWEGGDVLDPESGRLYRLKMRLDGGGTLVVHGYIGLALIGRSQTWTRVPE